MTYAAALNQAHKIAKDRVIVALDVDRASEAESIVAELRDLAGAFKIGLQLFTAAGPEFVRRVAQSSVRIFLDLKFHDIPNTVAKASVEAARLGVWMFNVHAIGGGEMMKHARGAMLEACAKENLDVPRMIAVTVLTSSNETTLAETGIIGEPNESVLRLARLAESAGLDGVVASPLECQLIKSDPKTADLLIVTPGIRPAGGASQDQKRISTPAAALRNGADHLVIGRAVTNAPDRANALAEILAEIESIQDQTDLPK